MQTSIIQTLSGKPGAENQNVPIAQTVIGDSFKSLFLQLEIDELAKIEKPELPDADTDVDEVDISVKEPQDPDESVVDTDIKLQESHKGLTDSDSPLALSETRKTPDENIKILSILPTHNTQATTHLIVPHSDAQHSSLGPEPHTPVWTSSPAFVEPGFVEKAAQETSVRIFPSTRPAETTRPVLTHTMMTEIPHGDILPRSSLTRVAPDQHEEITDPTREVLQTNSRALDRPQTTERTRGTVNIPQTHTDTMSNTLQANIRVNTSFTNQPKPGQAIQQDIVVASPPIPAASSTDQIKPVLSVDPRVTAGPGQTKSMGTQNPMDPRHTETTIQQPATQRESPPSLPAALTSFKFETRRAQVDTPAVTPADNQVIRSGIVNKAPEPRQVQTTVSESSPRTTIVPEAIDRPLISDSKPAQNSQKIQFQTYRATNETISKSIENAPYDRTNIAPMRTPTTILNTQSPAPLTEPRINPTTMTEEQATRKESNPYIPAPVAATFQSRRAEVQTATVNASNPTSGATVTATEVTEENLLIPEFFKFDTERLELAQTTHASTTNIPDSARSGTARFAAAQMADALIKQPNRPVEITLNPEELGRVRIALNHADSGLTVTITAERPETLDLMRRHIEQLAIEFRRLGYENIGFEFSGGDANLPKESEGGRHQHSESNSETVVQDIITPTSPQTTGIDIRI